MSYKPLRKQNQVCASWFAVAVKVGGAELGGGECALAC